MKRILLFAMGFLVVLAIGWLWFAFSRPASMEKNSTESPPVVLVKLAPLKREPIVQTIQAYGTVKESPNGIQTLVAPYECRVRRIDIVAGQQVSVGDLLLEIEPSPDSVLLMKMARNALESATKNLSNTQERAELKLVTAQEVLQAQQPVQETRLKVSSLESRGLGQDGKIAASGPGIVSKLDVQPGALVAAGNALVELSTAGNWEARLGVEPADVPAIKAGQSVWLETVARAIPTPLKGQVRVIARNVDPVTGLVDITVALASTEGLLLGDYVKAKIEIASKEALAAPRSALLPRGDRYAIFTVKDGHAVNHIVRSGLKNGARIEVIGGDLRPGDQVVMQGNYELADGVPVREETSP